MNHSKWNSSSHFASHHVKTLHSDMYHLSRDLAGRGRCQHSAGAENPGSAGWQKSELHWYGVCHPIFGVCHHKLINYYLLFPLLPPLLMGALKHNLSTYGWLECALWSVCVSELFQHSGLGSFILHRSPVLPHWMFLVCFFSWADTVEKKQFWISLVAQQFLVCCNHKCKSDGLSVAHLPFLMSLCRWLQEKGVCIQVVPTSWLILAELKQKLLTL